MSTATLPVPLTFREVLANDVIRRVWYAQLVSLFGDFLALFAVISVVSFRMHGTANQLTWVQISYMFPLVLLGPIAGVFVDRWPLKPTLIASDLLRAVLAMFLILTTTVWHVYVVLAALSCVSSFFGPAQTVTIRTHVKAEGLVAANALMQLAFMGARIVGPAAAGALVSALGPNSCYALDVFSFVVSASSRLRRDPSDAARGAQRVVQQSNPRHPGRHDGRRELHPSSRGDRVRRPRDGCRPVHRRLLRPAHRHLRAGVVARQRGNVRRRQRDGRRRHADRHAARPTARRGG